MALDTGKLGGAAGNSGQHEMAADLRRWR
jgi:hypothetical protein